MCAAATTETLQTAADVPLRASMPYCARLCSHYVLYMFLSGRHPRLEAEWKSNGAR